MHAVCESGVERNGFVRLGVLPSGELIGRLFLLECSTRVRSSAAVLGVNREIKRPVKSAAMCAKKMGEGRKSGPFRAF